MSFCSYKETIEEGDTVILYLSASNMYAIKVTHTIQNKHGNQVDNVFQTTYGALKVPSLIGKQFGAKVELTRGWAYILHPTPELWTLTLPHRTQIIYTPDISMIIFQLEIKPGSIVLEAGTGSGSLTHALARSVRPNGHVYTFDFHEQRVKTAREEFNDHGIEGVVTVQQRDVCRDGFGEELNGQADAIFLDLPHPWLVIEHSLKSFKTSGGRFCSFSPCIEQVQKTCSALRDSGFLEVNTVECLQREILVSTRTIPNFSISKEEGAVEKKSYVTGSYGATTPGHTGYLTLATLPPAWARDVGVVRGMEEEEEAGDEGNGEGDVVDEPPNPEPV